MDIVKEEETVDNCYTTVGCGRDWCVFHHGIESLPLEMLNMICKYLDWRDVENFEQALPRISVSGAKLDVVKRSLMEISNKKNVVGREIKSIESELHKTKKHYFYILFNLRYFIPYDIVHYF